MAGPDRIKTIRLSGPELATEGVYKNNEPFTRAINIVSQAYNINPFYLRYALGQLSATTKFEAFQKAKPSTVERRNAIAYHDLSTVRDNAMHHRSTRPEQNIQEAPHRVVFERAIHVLVFGYDEINNHSAEAVFASMPRPRAGGRGQTVEAPTIEAFKAMDDRIKVTNFEGLDIFPGWDQYLAQSLTLAVKRQPDAPFNLVTGEPNPTSSRQFPSYGRWAEGQGHTLSDEERAQQAVDEVLLETFPSTGFGGADDLIEATRQKGARIPNRDYRVRRVVREIRQQ